jgi:hypothetical protein
MISGQVLLFGLIYLYDLNAKDLIFDLFKSGVLAC